MPNREYGIFRSPNNSETDENVVFNFKLQNLVTSSLLCTVKLVEVAFAEGISIVDEVAIKIKQINYSDLES
jgi:hypothetical protein